MNDWSGRFYFLIVLVMAGLWVGGCADSGTMGPVQNNTSGECVLETDCAPEDTCQNNVCVPRDRGDTGSGSDVGEADADDSCPFEVSCAAAGVSCGQIPDGCGGTISCGTCADGDYCNNGVCSASRCENSGSCAGIQCGFVPDGCGGVINCGTCTGNTKCGNGPTRGQCILPDACIPRTNCAAAGMQCGAMPDGCGGFVQCGGCQDGHSCNSGTCERVQCTPKVKADFPGMECGSMPDGCGGVVDFGSNCPVGQVCGGSGISGKCGAPSCTPRTPAFYAGTKNCGPISDGCSGTIDLGACTVPGEICGGSGIANVCGADSRGADCKNLCLDQVVCQGGAATTITGRTFAPNGTLPIPNAAVYVPNVPISQLPAIASGASCERCEDEEFGDPLVATVSDELGNFTLRHVPAGVKFPLVIKVGKWRRVVEVGPVQACGTVALPAEQTRLPKRHQEGGMWQNNIPKTAFSTGYVDAMECVLKKIGVDADQFTGRGSSGRIHLYRGNGGTPNQAAANACVGCDIRVCSDNHQGNCSGSNQAVIKENLASHLYNNVNTLKSYDMVVFDCEGINAYPERNNTQRQNVLNYVNSGGRVFASHLSYSWLYQTNPLSTTATWYGTWQNENQSLAFVDKSHARGMAFWNWLVNVQANHPVNGANGEGQINIAQPRYWVKDNNKANSTRWVYTERGKAGHVGDSSVQQYSFDTPVGSSNACGRVVYSSFHVDEVDTKHGPAFPSYCVGTELTPQEKVLAFMLFDLGACITEGGGPPPLPVCVPQTCAQLNAACGSIGDGCGGVLNCGSCPSGSACGASGIPNQCGGECQKLTCGDHGAQCGTVPDGCGGTLNCGQCAGNQTCGANGVLNKCGCEPLTCESHGAQCGTVSDGCGGTLNCGECGPGQYCGVGVQANVCISEQGCQALTCEDHQANCGTVNDGCGGVLNCGTCEAPETCGGGGVRNECGSVCKPLTCADHGAQCGPISDGCGGVLNCGECDYLDVCENMQCVTPACLPAGGSCIDGAQCCSGVCAPGRDGAPGVCINT